MKYKEIVAECRSYFPHLRRHAVRFVYTETDWYGYYLPGIRSDTILINLGNCEKDGKIDMILAQGVLLHELIHCEQMAAGDAPSHGAYFVARREELMEVTQLYIPPGTPS